MGDFIRELNLREIIGFYIESVWFEIEGVDLVFNRFENQGQKQVCFKLQREHFVGCSRECNVFFKIWLNYDGVFIESVEKLHKCLCFF